MNGDLYAVTISGHCLINGVINHFIHQMVQALDAG